MKEPFNLLLSYLLPQRVIAIHFTTKSSNLIDLLTPTTPNSLIQTSTRFEKAEIVSLDKSKRPRVKHLLFSSL